MKHRQLDFCAFKTSLVNKFQASKSCIYSKTDSKARKQNKTQQKKNPNVWSYDSSVTESEGKYKVVSEIVDLDLSEQGEEGRKQQIHLLKRKSVLR